MWAAYNPFSPYAQKFPRQEPVDGQRIPTLDQVMDLVDQNGERNVEVWIEIKTSPENPKISSRPEQVARECDSTALSKKRGFCIAPGSFPLTGGPLPMSGRRTRAYPPCICPATGEE